MVCLRLFSNIDGLKNYTSEYDYVILQGELERLAAHGSTSNGEEWERSSRESWPW